MRVECSTSTRRRLRCARTSSGPWAACSALPPRWSGPRSRPQPGSYRTEYSWTGDAGTAAAITSAIRGWNHLRFEVTEDSTSGTEGARFSATPDLGVFHAVTGLHGDIMIPEDRLKAAVVKAALGETTLELEIDKLLGKPWDDELETFRHAGDGVAVRWLHQVV